MTETLQARLRDNYEHITSDTSELIETTKRQQQQLDQKEAAVAEIEQELARLAEDVKHFAEEKGTVLESQLDEGDQVSLQPTNRFRIVEASQLPQFAPALWARQGRPKKSTQFGRLPLFFNFSKGGWRVAVPRRAGRLHLAS